MYQGLKSSTRLYNFPFLKLPNRYNTKGE